MEIRAKEEVAIVLESGTPGNCVGRLVNSDHEPGPWVFESPMNRHYYYTYRDLEMIATLLRVKNGAVQ